MLQCAPLTLRLGVKRKVWKNQHIVSSLELEEDWQLNQWNPLVLAASENATSSKFETGAGKEVPSPTARSLPG